MNPGTGWPTLKLIIVLTTKHQFEYLQKKKKEKEKIANMRLSLV